MKLLVLILTIISVCYAQTDADWNSFQAKYGKYYRSASEASDRRAKWENNLKIINQHNEEFAKGLQTYTLGENQFADLTFEEFSNQYLGLSEKVLKEIEELPNKHKSDNSRALPSSVDLRTLNIVPPVRNQGSCGSCWAFSAIATVEGAWARVKNVPPPDLSEQQLVDCSKGLLGGSQSNFGCSGGWLEPTMDDIRQNGSMSEQSYAYTAKDGTCKYDSSKVVATISDFVSINTDSNLKNALALNNLVNCAMYVSNTFQLYKSGIYKPKQVENISRVNHAVAAIGYLISSDPSLSYTIYKNSWGTSWGENGFFRVLPDTLSLGKYCVYPIV